ncbi:MAG: zinc-finger domain-containing protein [Pseudomonadota bacterium]
MAIPPPETKIVETRIVACDGDEGPLGHPRVYLNMGKDGRVECPYCDRLYILKDSLAERERAA